MKQKIKSLIFISIIIIFCVQSQIFYYDKNDINISINNIGAIS